MQKDAVKITQIWFETIINKITYMEKLALKYFQHINRIIKIMQPQLISNSKLTDSYPKTPSASINFQDQELERELKEMKQYIQNLLRYCHKIEIQNKSLKKSLSTDSQILEQNLYVIGQNEPIINKNRFQSSKSLSFQNDKSFGNSQSQELKKTRSLYLDSLKKIQQLKNQISLLNQRLNMADSNIYRSYPQDPQFRGQGCFYSYENQVKSKNQLDVISESCDLNIENLYCHQSLDFSEDFFKQNNSRHSNIGNQIVDCLISKGIEYRQQRTLKSPQFKHLNTIVEKYRSHLVSACSQFPDKRAKNILYR